MTLPPSVVRTNVLSGLTVAFALVPEAIAFAGWQHASQIAVRTRQEADGSKVYELEGTLFFASAKGFQNLFSPKDDPAEVVVEFGRAKVMDHSAIEAIDTLAERYQKLGKRLHLRHLSGDCAELLIKAGSMVEVDLGRDLHYHLADDRLG